MSIFSASSLFVSFHVGGLETRDSCTQQHLTKGFLQSATLLCGDGGASPSLDRVEMFPLEMEESHKPT